MVIADGLMWYSDEYSDVLMVLFVRIVPVVSIWKSFSGLFLCSDHLFHSAFEFFITSWVLFVEILELPLG